MPSIASAEASRANSYRVGIDCVQTAGRFMRSVEFWMPELLCQIQKLWKVWETLETLGTLEIWKHINELMGRRVPAQCRGWGAYVIYWKLDTQKQRILTIFIMGA